MKSKLIIQTLAILCIMFMIVPNFVKAESTAQETIINAPSEHNDAYNEVVNVANDTAIQNYQTWDPVPQGIWIGGSTKESLFKLNTVMPNGSFGIITYEFSMSASQIMSGASEFVVRLPISFDSGISSWFYEMYQISESRSYEIYEYTHFLWAPTPEPRLKFASDAIMVGGKTGFNSTIGYPASSAYYDSDNFWTSGDRGYIRMSASIVPDVLYLFVFYVEYKTDARVKVYLSPNDVCSDKIFRSSVNTFINTIDGSIISPNELNVDMGISFDMLMGESNGFSNHEFIVYPGDTISIWGYAKLAGTLNYHTLMIPFWTQNHTASFSIDVSLYGSGKIWDQPAQVFYNYIAESSDSTLSIPNTADDNYYLITLTAQWTQKISFLFFNNYKFDGNDQGYPVYDGAIINRTNSAVISHSDGVSRDDNIFQMLVSSYQLATSSCVQPTDVDVNNPWPYNSKPFNLEYFVDTLAIQWLNLLTTGVVGIVIDVVAGVSVGRALYPYLKDFANGAVGFIRNAIDAAWKLLQAIGEFIVSIGEMIYNALTWLYDNFLNYSSQLVGIIICVVIFLLFFFLIWGQIKLYAMGYRLIKGDLEGAAEMGNSIVSAVGKIKGL